MGFLWLERRLNSDTAKRLGAWVWNFLFSSLPFPFSSFSFSFSYYFLIHYLGSMDALNSLNPVRTRNRANSAVSTLPTPLSPEHTNHRHSQPDPNWRRSQPELSSSAPQTSYLQSHPTSASSMDSRHTSTTNGTDGITNSLSVDFEGGAHVIVRPNRIIRGKLEQKRTGALITD